VYVTAAAHDGSVKQRSVANVWNIIRAGTPFLADWTRNRPFLTGDFLFENLHAAAAAAAAAPGGVGAKPNPATEAAAKAAEQLASFPVPLQVCRQQATQRALRMS
jgi:hypothetical protein